MEWRKISLLLFFYLPLSKKREMRVWRLFLLVAVAVASIVSCGEVELASGKFFPYRGELNQGVISEKGDDEQEDGDEEEDEEVEPQERMVLCMSGIEYPDGYDWLRDERYGLVECRLFLEVEGERVLEIDVADTSFVASDHDMHRIVDGHIYTDFSTSAETIIKRDGEEVLRYPSREAISGLIVKDSTIHTLGISRSGWGFTYRQNGRVVLEKKNGYIIRSLYEDEGRICFSYYESLSEYEKVYKYYLFKGGRSLQIGDDERITEVCDIISIEGQIYYLAQEKNIKQLLVCSENEQQALELGTAERTQNCRFIQEAEEVLVAGELVFENEIKTAVWKKGKLASEINEEIHRIEALLSEDYSFFFPEAVMIWDEKVLVGLTDKLSSLPYIWSSDESYLKSLDFNGYVTGFSLCKESVWETKPPK
jgi:hypothetical protein